MSGERMDVVEGMKAIRDAGYVLLSPEQATQVREWRDDAIELRITERTARDRAIRGAQVAVYDRILALLEPKP